MNQRVLITGGFGYLGGRIALAIAHNSDWIVRLGSRIDQSAPPWLSQAETIAMDFSDSASLSHAVQDVQAVIHLAAMNEHQCLEDPAMAVIVNTQGTLNILDAAISEGAQRFVYFSTAHIYGAPLVGCLSEKTIPRPTHPYAITHHGAEDFVLACHDQKKIEGIVLRLSNGFGAPAHPQVDRWTLLVNDLCRQAVETRKMVLHSSGLQHRDFITLTDVGNAAIHFLNLPQELCGDGLFNLGGGMSLSVWHMTQRIASRCRKVLGFIPEVIRQDPEPADEVQEIVYLIEKLKKTGCPVTGLIDKEIDEMLIFCHDAFGS